MKQYILGGLFLSLLLTLIGCEDSGDNGNEATSGAGGPAPLSGSGGGGVSGTGNEAGTGANTNTCESMITETDDNGNPLIQVKDAQNYTFQASLNIQTTRVKSLSNLVFDWSAVTKDLRNRDLDPLTGVDQLRVALFEGVTENELMELMASEGDILQYVVGVVYVNTDNTITSANLLDLQPPGAILTEEEILDYVDTTSYPPENYSYSVMLGEGETLNQGFLLINYVRPDPNETNTEVKLTNDSTKLSYTVDLTSMQKIALPAGDANVTMKWTDDTLLTTTAGGIDFLPTAITMVMIGHYPNMTVADLEKEFLNIDGVADKMWIKYLSVGTSVSLADLETESGEPFTGITDQGTWVFALMCGNCTSPAPWFLNVLETCSQ